MEPASVISIAFLIGAYMFTIVDFEKPLGGAFPVSKGDLAAAIFFSVRETWGLW